MSTHELFDFMQQAADEIQDEYARIVGRSREDPGTAGDEGEENWRALLAKWLPPQYPVVTKGRIISPTGKASPQVDVLVLHPAYPAGLLHKKLYLAGGVLAAFECKLTLRSPHIRAAFDTAVALTDITGTRSGTPYRELHRPIIYGLLAHSHEWKQPGSNPEENIQLAVQHADLTIITSPNQMPDLLCVADVGTWTAMKHSTGCVPVWTGTGWIWNPGELPHIITAYSLHLRTSSLNRPFSNIGAMISDLWLRLGRDHADVRSIADYFRAVGLPGDKRGYVRTWPLSVYSDDVRTKIGDPSPPGHSREGWSEWSSIFPG